MSRKDGWHPAFPSKVSESTDGYFAGMSLRDYFAAAAVQGELASQSNECGVWNRETTGKLASWCYAIADAMLAERDK